MWPLYIRLSYATKDEWDTSDNDSLTATADENDPDMNDFYQRVASSDDENYLCLGKFSAGRISLMLTGCSVGWFGGLF